MNTNNLIVANKEHLADISTFKKTDEEKQLAKELKKQFKAKQNGNSIDKSTVLQPIQSGQD